MKWDLGQFAKIKLSLAGILLPSLPPLRLSAQLSFLDSNQSWQRVEGGTEGKQNLLVLLGSSHPCHLAQISRISCVQWCSVEWDSKDQAQGCVDCSPLANPMFHTAASLPSTAICFVPLHGFCDLCIVALCTWETSVGGHQPARLDWKLSEEGKGIFCLISSLLRRAGTLSCP